MRQTRIQIEWPLFESTDFCAPGAVGSSLVMFMRHWPATFTGVSYPASGATTQYVSDMQPNMPYQITGDGAPGSAHSDSAGVLTFASAGTGSIHVAPAK